MTKLQYSYPLIDQLVAQGISHFCIAPGSRSTPLALAAARHEGAQVHVHFDERGLGFFALGLSIASHRPVAIIVTSGTAVGNLLPAVMEAHHRELGLILLTADRPPELREIGANQTTQQMGIFEHFVVWQAELSVIEGGEHYIRSQAAHAYFQALQGPVHLNCPFREPLFTPVTVLQRGKKQERHHGRKEIIEETLSQCYELLENVPEGLVVVGEMDVGRDLSVIAALADHLKWPVYADILSQWRCSGCSEVRHLERGIQGGYFTKPSFVLHFGGRCISTAITGWLKECPRIHVHHKKERIDPYHQAPLRIDADPILFAQKLYRHLINPSVTTDPWVSLWKEIDQEIGEQIDACFQKEHSVSEWDLMRFLSEHLVFDTDLFLANSLPIRAANHDLYAPGIKAFFANRGVSGIDGQLATAIGIAIERDRPMIAILGDQSFLYDLNSILLLKKVGGPFTLLVVNNDGGGIFSQLPVAQEPDHFERLFGVPHGVSFEKIAQWAGIHYTMVEQLGELQVLLQNREKQIIEVKIPSRTQSIAFQRELGERIATKSLRSATTERR